MTEVVLFHHALGRTDGVRSLAGFLEGAGHTVHVPDLYDGHTFDDLDAGVAHAADTGFDEIVRRGADAVDGLPREVVYLGQSLGVLPAQRLAQTRPGARGAVLLHACVPPAEFGGWPGGVPAQVHAMADDPIFVDEGDLDAARELVRTVPDAELFLYPGVGHLFADPGTSSYDDVAAALLRDRVLGFLDRVGSDD